MALIKITASELEGVHSQIAKMSGKVSDCSSKVSSVRNGLDMQISAKRNIEDHLDNIKRDLDKYAESLNSYANVLNDVINEFVRADSSTNGLNLALLGNVEGVLKGTGLLGLGYIASTSGLPPGVYPMTGTQNGISAGLALAQLKCSADLWADSSIKKEETGFWGSIWNKGKEIGNKDKTLYGNVIQAGKKITSWAKGKIDEAVDSYKNKGTVYKAVQYGKAALKVGKSVVKVVGAVSAIGGAVALASTGVGIPAALAAAAPAVVSLVSAGNDFINGVTDMAYVHEEQYDMVGQTNVLKDYLTDATGDLGEYLGNREIGEKIGNIVYTGIDVVTFLDGADKMLTSMGKANTVLTGEYGSSSGWAWNWEKTSFDEIMKTELKFSLEPDFFVRKIMKVHPASDANIIYEAAKNVYNILGKAAKLGEQIGSL